MGSGSDRVLLAGSAVTSAHVVYSKFCKEHLKTAAEVFMCGFQKPLLWFLPPQKGCFTETAGSGLQISERHKKHLHF